MRFLPTPIGRRWRMSQCTVSGTKVTACPSISEAQGGVGAQARLAGVLAQIRSATRYRLVGWRVAEAPRRFPPPRSAPVEAACNLLPAVLGSELGTGEVDGTGEQREEAGGRTSLTCS
jgi:hypothetical protein